MSANSSIEWTDRTWNPLRGCSMAKGSETGGCLNCYAARIAARNLPELRSPTTGRPFAVKRDSGPRWTGEVELIESKLTEPLHWRKPQSVFVNSMSDLFHESVPDEWIDRIFAVMALAPQHTFQILTKRPERMREYITSKHCLWNGFPEFVGPTISTHNDVEAWCREHGVPRKERERRIGIINDGGGFEFGRYEGWPLQNVWLIVSVENQPTADERIKELLQTPAAVRGISAEPLLSATNLHLHEGFCRACKQWTKGTITGHCFDPTSPCFAGEMCVGDGIDWVIVGGESGPGARPCHVDWVRSIASQCRGAAVACFVKQLGSFPVVDNDEDTATWARHVGRGTNKRAPDYWREPWPWVPTLRDHKGGDMSEWPEDVRVREFPRVEVPA